ncbi:MAG: HAMP domain-containing protein [Flavobacteriales bacterium]|nr:HAMP domain-containing protein [Flavobacteriales bacterium]
MKTKARLTLALGALTLMVFILAGVGFATIWSLRGEGRGLLQANYTSIEYMQGMLTILDERSDSASARERTLQLLQRQQANITESGEDQATVELARSLDTWFNTGVDPDSTEVLRSRIARIVELNRDAIGRRVAAAERKGENALVWIGLTGTFCALIALSMLFSIPEHIVDPIRKLTEGIDRIAQGHYGERVELRRSDEFGHMADRFNAMAAELERWKNSNLARTLEEKARAEAVINSLQDASIGLDLQGVVLFANQQALDLLAINATDIVGRHADVVARESDLLRALLTDHRPGPLKIVKDGREQFFLCEHQPIDRAGERLGTIVVVRNVTPFEEKDRAKSYFLATISHELKTPLSSTDIGLSLLERQHAEGLTPEQAAIVADMRKDHQRLVRIVSELLDITQVETGNIRVSVADHRMDDLLDEALSALKVTAKQKDILFARRTTEDEVIVRADRDKAVWVLVNLLGNAVRHSPDRGVITIGTTKDGGHIQLTISDQGPGIPPDVQARLFNRFAPGSGPRHGTGLGLSIAQEFMLAMGGGIAFEPSAYEGATFVLTFATAQAAA